VDPGQELLNVYDAEGHVIGQQPRRAAKASGHAVGAVNALIVNLHGELLMQRRPRDKENGGLWDKSVGGHVSAGEDFDTTLCREAGEELFDDGASRQVRLVSADAFAGERLAARFDHEVLLFFVSLQRNLRDVRHAPERAGVRNVVYHVAVYLGLTALPLDAFRPQRAEIDELRFVPASEVDRLLLAGKLAPNMSFAWLTHAGRLLGLP
jgi:8-oxo-dGTP pyrophosphatase MutT (NUDIX family)